MEEARFEKPSPPKFTELSPEPVVIESLVRPKSEVVRPFEKKPKESIIVEEAVPIPSDSKAIP